MGWRFGTLAAAMAAMVTMAAPAAAGASSPSIAYEAVVDHHDTALPTAGQYYNCTGGDRGVLHAEEMAYEWDGDCAYTATVSSCAGLWTWGGMWYSLIRPNVDNTALDFGAIFGPYVQAAFQGEVTAVEIGVERIGSESANPTLALRVELKGPDGGFVGSHTWMPLAPSEDEQVFSWTLPEDCKQPVKEVLWILDGAKPGDSITVDRVVLRTAVPDLAPRPTAAQAFLWSYAWLLASYDPATGMVQDRSGFRWGDLENVSASAKAAKIACYAYQLGFTTREAAEGVVTKVADTLIHTVPRGPEGKNGLWPHFTRGGGTEALPPHDGFAGSEWASGDTAFAALDLIAALQMIGDPEGQIEEAEQLVEGIDWDALTVGGYISHGYTYEGDLLPSVWSGFGMETAGVLWACAAAGHSGLMEPPPSDNGSGFIDNAQYPMVLSGIDRWGNDWDAYRQGAADCQIGWYTPGRNPYLSAAGLFGLSAAEVPEIAMAPPVAYRAYGVGGAHSPAEDGDGEVVVLHYPAMIADLRPLEAAQAWEVLRDRAADWLQDVTVISPLNNMESMRVDKTTGRPLVNHLKGSWNLALQAEGWALADAEVRAALLAAVRGNAFLRKGHDWLVPPSPHLAVSVVADKSQAKPGEIITYTISYANDGEGTAHAAVLTDPLPEHTGLVRPGQCPFRSGRTACWLLGDLEPGATGTCTVELRVEPRGRADLAFTVANTARLACEEQPEGVWSEEVGTLVEVGQRGQE